MCVIVANPISFFLDKIFIDAYVPTQNEIRLRHASLVTTGHIPESQPEPYGRSVYVVKFIEFPCKRMFENRAESYFIIALLQDLDRSQIGE